MQHKSASECGCTCRSSVIHRANVVCVVEPELSGLTEDQGPPPPPRTGDHPPMTQQSRVSFAEGTTFERERTGRDSVLHMSILSSPEYDDSIPVVIISACSIPGVVLHVSYQG